MQNKTPLWLRTLPLLRRFSMFGEKGDPDMVVYRCDGTSFHGGLCDRFKGIVSCYAYAKATGRKFRILYNFPFQLEEFLLPGSYDWRPQAGEVCTSIWHVALRRMAGHETIYDMRELEEVRHKQQHIYANRNYIDQINKTYGTKFTFGELFAELFRPTEELRNSISRICGEIGGHNLTAVHFRFQSVLGDFKEFSHVAMHKGTKAEDDIEIETTKREEIVANCMSALRKIADSANTSTRIVVASDSEGFLDIASQLPNVFALRGRSIHIDSCQEGVGHPEYLKVFEDFFVLASAQHIYSVATPEMYRSDFPLTAALIGGGTFERIDA